MTTPSYISHDVSLASHTTLQLGGQARYFAHCTNIKQLKICLKWAEKNNLPIQILGAGSNTIFADSGYKGLVIQVALLGRNYSNSEVTVAAGESWDAFVSETIKMGLAGIECLSGIPGNVGATPIQNVGAYGQEVSQTITWVEALNRRTMEITRFNATECEFTYRNSRFKGRDSDRFVITSVHFSLRSDGTPQISYPDLIQAKHKDASNLKGAETLSYTRQLVMQLRTSKSMILDPNDPNSRSVGSFFLNPILDPQKVTELQKKYPELPSFPELGKIKIPAAWLVENAGFTKGYRRGGVGISNNHALALVNFKGNTDELLTLASEIQQSIKEKFDIHLEREPVVVTN